MFLQIVSTLILSIASQASPCSDLYAKSGAMEFQRFQGQMNCQVLASPAQAGTDYYRAAVYTDEGLFMVFNSYEYAKGTDGARVFYFFPRTGMPAFKTNASGEMVIQTATPGISLVYDKAVARFARMTGGLLKEDPQVHQGNNGGVELEGLQTLWLDAGFKYKGDPTADASRSSTFIDKHGKRCTVSNKEIFEFTDDGDSFFRFTDQELKEFLLVRCAGLTHW